MVDFPSKDKYNAEDYRALVEVLRGEGGCPWDRAQTHATLRRFLLEESAELCEAIDENDAEHMKEELGDVWLQILLHASIEQEKGTFDLDDVADASCKKLIFRHPFVFGGQTVSAEEAYQQWEAVKRVEKQQKTASQAMNEVCRTLPSLWRAGKIQKKGADFLWEDADAAEEAVRGYAEQLRTAEGEAWQKTLGELLFAANAAARLRGADAEESLHAACEEHIRRFAALEESALAQGMSFEDMSGAEKRTFAREHGQNE